MAGIPLARICQRDAQQVDPFALPLPPKSCHRNARANREGEGKGDDSTHEERPVDLTRGEVDVHAGDILAEGVAGRNYRGWDFKAGGAASGGARELVHVRKEHAIGMQWTGKPASRRLRWRM